MAATFDRFETPITPAPQFRGPYVSVSKFSRLQTPYGTTDTTAPTLNPAFSPAAGTITRTATVTIPLIDVDSQIADTTAWVIYGDGTSEVIYAGGAFTSQYSTSTQTGTPGNTPGTINLLVTRTGGWKQSTMTLHVSSSDNSGNKAAYTSAYTISNPPGAPVLNPAFSPAAGTITRTDAITVPIIADASTFIADLTIWAVFTNGFAETIWANGAFTANYSASSRFAGTVGVSQAVSATLVRTGDWNQATLALHAVAIDGADLTASFSSAYTISNPTFGLPDTVAPRILSLTPSPPTSPTTNQAVTFIAVDDRQIRIVTVNVNFADGTTERVYDGHAFTTLYSSLSTVTGDTISGFNFSILRTGGWKPGALLQITVTDTSGNTV